MRPFSCIAGSCGERSGASRPVLALVLAGILIGTLFSACTSLIKYVADPYEKLPAITFWLMGSLGLVSNKELYASDTILGLMYLANFSGFAFDIAREADEF